ncbi:MAG: hypothetical protein OXE05_04760 [Chloroflexi bacterium]|nr:hypothetical protein [Chloroflexota bacterium]
MMTVPEEGIPLTSIAGAFPLDFLDALIERVLQSRGQASGSVRKGLDSAIDESIRVPGFRSASKAHPSQLKRPVLGEVVKYGNDRLFGEALRAWAESQQELHTLVERHLRSQDLPVEGPNRRQGIFNGFWLRVEWNDTVDMIVQQNPDFNADDVGMMVCYLSGMAVGPAVTSPLLTSWIHELSELPLDTPEWDEIGAFVTVVSEMADDIAIERIGVIVRHCRKTFREMQDEFATELAYLALDIGAWAETAIARPAGLTDALDLAEDLRRNLAEYQGVRPQAPSRQEEEERAPVRAEREAAILEIVTRWSDTFPAMDSVNGGETPGDAADVPGAAAAGEETDQDRTPPAAAERADSVADAETQETPSREDYQSLLSDCEQLERERGWFRDEIDRLQSEHDRLAQANTSVEAERRSLDSENIELRAKLKQGPDLEEYWRRFYGASPFEQVKNVNEAISRAQELFPEQLVFALNSKSDKESPFQRPAEAFAALVWLATDYHHLRWTKPGEDPRFEERLKKSCPGWSYKPHQSNATKKQFVEWYETVVEGRRYELGEHLGKGTSADPQKTIRIAFAWDDERGRVVVGYVGVHQRNRRS